MAQMDAALDPLTPKKGLIDALMGGSATAGNMGIAPGEMSPNAGPPPVLDPPMAAPPMQDGPKAAPVQDWSNLNLGFNRDKLNDPNKHDAKYDMARTLNGFDARQGFNPDSVAALNKLGYGTFSGQGDKLSLSGLTDVGRKAGLTGDYNGADFIEGLHSGNGKWSYADPAAEAAQGAQGGGQSPAMGMPSLAGGNLNPLLQGNAQGGIQSALGQYSQQSDFLKQLLAKLQGGGQ